MQASQRDRFCATVAFNRPICREHFLLRLRLANGFPPTRAGQFVQLGCQPPLDVTEPDWESRCEHTWTTDGPIKLNQPELCGPVALLRRPFSIAGRCHDDRGVLLDIIHRVVGVGTSWLAQLNPSDPVDLIGPLGNRFVMPADKSIALLVAGGVGLPPMLYFAETLAAARWQAVAFIGALTADLLAVTPVNGTQPDTQGDPTTCIQEFARYGFKTVVTTDDGSLGLAGRITGGLERLLLAQSPDRNAQTVIYTCGPEPMMQAVARLAASFAIDCQVCLERSMACGMGTCQSCVAQIADPHDGHAHREQDRPWRYRLVCSDGPVFSGTDVVWPSR